jgi:hypothetical protein
MSMLQYNLPESGFPIRFVFQGGKRFVCVYWWFVVWQLLGCQLQQLWWIELRPNLETRDQLVVAAQILHRADMH